MIPFPLRWQLPRPINEDERLYAQAFCCLAGASWQNAAFESALTAPHGGFLPAGARVKAMAARRFADELIEGACAYMQLRAQLRELAPVA